MVRLLTERDVDRGSLRSSPARTVLRHHGPRSLGGVPIARTVRRAAPGLQAAQDAGRSTHLVSWAGGHLWVMVVDGYVWTRVPRTDVEVYATASTSCQQPP